MKFFIFTIFTLTNSQIWNPLLPQPLLLPQQMPILNFQQRVPMQLDLPIHNTIPLPMSLQSTILSNNIAARGRPEIGGTIESIAATQNMINTPDFARVSLLNFLNDKDNFHAQGCGYDGIREYCHDALNLCKGGCRDFGNSAGIHDCRCVPLGYANIIASLG
uniref:Uncharacterized protein n=1 Tax=Strongyloides stercoralis TaxID=6248 RepID=A0A0K0DVN1_STRER